MYKLLSDRIKNRDGDPEVYIYDNFSAAFRNQFFYIMSDVLDELMHCCCDWDDLHDEFCREKGLKLLGDWNRNHGGYGRHNCELFIAKTNNFDLLDFVDFVFHIFEEKLIFLNIIIICLQEKLKIIIMIQ